MAKTSIEKRDFRGRDAFILSNGFLEAAVLPERGAKIASLIHRSAGADREIFDQPPGDGPLRIPAYGDDFQGQDGSGFDDMFPNIAPCTMTKAPWTGMRLPDHGEVWSRPAACETRDDGLECETRSVRLPAILRKTIRLAGNELHITYDVENESEDTLPFQWAAHAIFAMHAGSRLEAPAGMNRIVNAYPGNRLPQPGTSYAYPLPDGAEGFDLSRIPEFTPEGAQKYWFSETMTDGWFRLVHPDWNVAVTMEFPLEKLPYLGIWVNEGGWNGGYNVGIEPSTCRGDDPVTSGAAGFGSELDPRGRLTWYLSMKISEID